MFWLLLILIFLLILSIPAYPYSRGWGYYPFGILWAVILGIMLFWLFGLFTVAV